MAGKLTAHRIYNWLPDLPDQRDFLFSEKPPLLLPLAKLPESVDLRSNCSPIFNQGKIGSCTGNALAASLEFLELKEMKTKGGTSGPEVFTPGKFAHVSRLFVYYNERSIRGTTDQDSGAMLRDGIKSLVKWGACRESVWKYSATQVLRKPSVKAYAEAKNHEISSYYSVRSLLELKRALSLGYPVAFGFTVYESFESPEVAKTGEMPLPGPDERALGGHAVLAVGYSDSKQRLIIRNSWGQEWGLQGYFTMPYSFIEAKGLAQDFWMIQK